MTDNEVFEPDQVSEARGRNGVSGSKVIHMEPLKNANGATVSFHNIRYTVKLKSGCVWKRTSIQKEILMDLNGIMRPGLNAILGPTGSGKSSFLDVLAARKDPVGLSGEVLINGVLQPPNFKCLSGYVVQEDILMGTLTVRENLSFSAALRLSSQISTREKMARVSHLIAELGLNKVADAKAIKFKQLTLLCLCNQVGTQMIRGISGGERKRTSIGMELIIDPSVLFLDEPTSGLDASTAHSVLLLLKRMAGQGRTIILSIHQPRFSIFRLFDGLTLLAGGKQVYHGPAQDALEYFSNIGYACEAHNNPADFFLDVINGSCVTKIQNYGDLECDVSGISKQGIEDQLVEKYRNCSFACSIRAELELIALSRNADLTGTQGHSITYCSSFYQQLRWLVVTTLMAAIVGAIFFGVKDDQSGIQNRFGVLFFITTNQCFSTLSAAELFISERKLFIHEYTTGYYRVSVYFLSKILSDIITQRTIPTLLFTCVVYFMIGLKPEVSAFLIFLLTVILVACTATAMTMAISADQSVVAVANIFMTISFIFMMADLFRSAGQSEKHNGLALMAKALEINEFVGLKFCGNFSSVVNGPAADVLMCTGEQQLAFQGIDFSSWGLWQNHVALTLLTLCFLIIAYIKLRFLPKFS
ncbi:hypothetical protein DNTS_002547 [Danionella cerebrum]|uniref:Broad substrate specificity ATP-binding cassette transporter ABCG2 n=1 Tax=Danionella cerebrum TaxID=2873325 RepID=A0A553MSP2_9TELE|nr:hypothetical protein DNTS_002547 [Danionella translucida]